MRCNAHHGAEQKKGAGGGYVCMYVCMQARGHIFTHVYVCVRARLAIAVVRSNACS